MRQPRECRWCGRPETEVFLSKRLSCERCARARVLDQVSRAYRISRELPDTPPADLDEAIVRSTAVSIAVHEDAVRRRAEENAARANRRRARRT